MAEQEIFFGEADGSFEQPPVVIPFTAASLGLEGEVTYQGKTESVYAEAGIPLVTDYVDLRAPEGETSHSWYVRVTDNEGSLIGYSESASILDPEHGGTKERLVASAVEAALLSPDGLPKEHPFGTHQSEV